MMDSKAAAEVHDHFIDGAIFARGAARQMGIDLDEQHIRNYRWGNSAQTLRTIVAMSAGTAGGAV